MFELKGMRRHTCSKRWVCTDCGMPEESQPVVQDNAVHQRRANVGGCGLRWLVAKTWETRKHTSELGQCCFGTDCLFEKCIHLERQDILSAVIPNLEDASLQACLWGSSQPQGLLHFELD